MSRSMRTITFLLLMLPFLVSPLMVRAQTPAPEQPAEIERLERALAAFREAQDRHGEARTLKELAVLLHSSGDAAKAAELIEVALQIVREVRDPDLEARLSNNLGLALQDLKGGQSGRTAFEKSLKIAQAHGNEAVEAIALANLADLDLARNDAREALPRLERAAVLARKLGNPNLAARVLATLAQVHDTLDYPKEAVRLYEEALAHARASGQRLGEAGVLNGLGMALLKAGQPDKAIETHQKALPIAREAQDLETEGAALIGLALTYEELKDSAREAEVAQRLLEIAEALDNEVFRKTAERHIQGSRERERSKLEAIRLRAEIAAALERGDRAAGVRLSFDLGLLLLGEAEIEQAAQAFDQSLVLSGEIRDRAGQNAALQALVRINDRIVNSPRLSEYLTHMSQTAGELGLRELEGLLLVQLGLDRLTAHDPKGALNPLERGLSLVTELHRQDVVLTALDALVLAERLLENSRAAVSHAERLLSEARKANDPIMTGAALHQLAWAAQERGDLVQATELAEQGLAATERVPGADDRRAPLFSSLGVARFGVGDYDGALDAFVKMQQAAQKATDRKGEALALQFQAGVKLIKGERDTSKSLLTNSMVIGAGLEDPEVAWQALASLGTLAALDNDYHKAAEHWQELLEVVRRPTSPLFSGFQKKLEVITLGYLARAHANLGKQSQALELADSAVALANQEGEGFEQALALDARAYTHLTSGRLPAAEADARAAIDMFEAARARFSSDELAKAGALDQQSSLYDAYQQILVRQGRHADALAAAELGRARALAEALGKRESRPATPEDLKKIARSLGATLVEFSILHDPTQFLIPGRLEGLRANLEDELYIWVLQPTGQVGFRSVDLKGVRSSRGETLSQQVDYLLKQLNQKNGSGAELRASLRDLHDKLITPIADFLPRDPEAPVIIVPHGVLFSVPFPALLDQDGRYLVQRYTLLTVPSIESLIRLRRARPMGERIGSRALIVGNPRTSRPSLPKAEEQAKELAVQLGTRALVGEQATEVAMFQALPDADLVVFAGHGLLDERGQGKVPGALALTPSSAGEDGLLTSDEIRALDLKADLVVLSACESGVGRISGDGVMGLPRSFLAAGAAGVVMSLWRIDDEATSDLMIDFHRRLPTSDPARALRGAMLAAIERGEGPRDWGAFSYIGAPRAAPARLSAP